MEAPDAEPAMADAGSAAGLPVHVLYLYVAGSGSRSLNAIANIKAICEQYLPNRHELVVIDLYQQPELAKAAQIVAIPTLVKALPLPLRRIVGDLSDTAQVCATLDIARPGNIASS